MDYYYFVYWIIKCCIKLLFTKVEDVLVELLYDPRIMYLMEIISQGIMLRSG